LAKEFDFHHISVGDLLREEDKSPSSPFQGFISKSIKKAVVVPAQLTTQLLEKEMSKAQAAGKNKFLLDGFPRSITQVVDFELKVAITVSLLFNLD
jgi:adenylate kinase family enzyme